MILDDAMKSARKNAKAVKIRSTTKLKRLKTFELFVPIPLPPQEVILDQKIDSKFVFICTRVIISIGDNGVGSAKLNP